MKITHARIHISTEDNIDFAETSKHYLTYDEMDVWHNRRRESNKECTSACSDAYSWLRFGLGITESFIQIFTYK